MNQMQILVLDFGSQYTQLIARRLREYGIYTEIVPYFEDIDSIRAKNPKGIILGGGPASVYEKDAYKPDSRIFTLGIPILGICYGMQVIAQYFGGRVIRAEAQEFGKAVLHILNSSQLPNYSQSSINAPFISQTTSNMLQQAHTQGAFSTPEAFSTQGIVRTKQSMTHFSKSTLKSLSYSKPPFQEKSLLQQADGTTTSGSHQPLNESYTSQGIHHSFNESYTFTHKPKQPQSFLLQGENIALRPFVPTDELTLEAIFKDNDLKAIWESYCNPSGFNVLDWLDTQMQSYEESGFGIYAALHSNEIIGQVGLSIQEIPTNIARSIYSSLSPQDFLHSQSFQPSTQGHLVSIFYLFKSEHWHKGYATQAAKMCIEYAFNTLGIPVLCALIPTDNIAAQNVAKRLEMSIIGKMDKPIKDKSISHFIYILRASEWQCMTYAYSKAVNKNAPISLEFQHFSPNNHPLSTELKSQLLKIWGDSVRATHHFLREEHIIEIADEVEASLPQLTIITASDHRDMVGFIGLLGNKIEMLFIRPSALKKGIGRALIKKAIELYLGDFEEVLLDCNEENADAIKFYHLLGFEIRSRSSKDNAGRDFALVHFAASSLKLIRYFGLNFTPPLFYTKRLIVREMRESDLASLNEMLLNHEVMSAWEYDFSDSDVKDWLKIQQEKYAKFGFGLWAVVEKCSGEMIGQAGLSIQNFDKQKVLGMTYIIKKSHWHKGYGIEVSQGCKHYAFEVLGAKELYCLIKENNTASIALAQKLGATLIGETLWKYRGRESNRLVYKIKNELPIAFELETTRTLLRPIEDSDFLSLKEILQDKEVMSAWGESLNDNDLRAWISAQQENYAHFGFGLWGIIDKQSRELIGIAGLSATKYLEISYVLKKSHWHKGYAIEIAQHCKQYVFRHLRAKEVYCVCREDNLASHSVAKRIGMSKVGEFVDENNYNYFEFCAKNHSFLPHSLETYVIKPLQTKQALCESSQEIKDKQTKDLDSNSLLNSVFLETERLILRPLLESDIPELAKLLQDKDVMWAWVEKIDYKFVKKWLKREQESYLSSKMGWCALIEKHSGAFIGQAGLHQKELLEISYMLHTDYWHKGYATEIGLGLKEYAFQHLRAKEVYCVCREDNFASQKVAQRLGMQKVDEKTDNEGKTYYAFCVQASDCVPHNVLQQDELFSNIKQDSIVWMSHADKVESIPQGFRELARSGNTHYCAIADSKRKIYALQFHPEVVHSECGGEILRNFAVGICGSSTDWNMQNFAENEIAKLRSIVGVAGITETEAAEVARGIGGEKVKERGTEVGAVEAKTEVARGIAEVAEVGIGLGISKIESKIIGAEVAEIERETEAKIAHNQDYISQNNGLNYTIALAQKQDLEAILALQSIAYADEARLIGKMDIEPMTQDLQSIEQEFNTHTFLKCTLENGEIIGSVRGVTKGETTYIRKLFVKSAYRRKGIASALIRTLCAKLSSKRYELFTSEKSLKNIALYEKLGFVCFKKEFIEGFPIKAVFLEKFEDFKRVIETERLILREYTQADFKSLHKILSDKEVMHAWGQGFREKESQEWLTKQLLNYQQYGFGIWAIIDRQSGEIIGNVGLDYEEIILESKQESYSNSSDSHSSHNLYDSNSSHSSHNVDSSHNSHNIDSPHSYAPNKAFHQESSNNSNLDKSEVRKAPYQESSHSSYDSSDSHNSHSYALDKAHHKVLELGYVLKKSHWHKGYGIEAARACVEYAFEVVRARKLYALITKGHQDSITLAQRLGMRLIGVNAAQKHKEELVYCLELEEYKKANLLFSSQNQSISNTTPLPIKRCAWASDKDEKARKLYENYHDNEWGVPLHNDRKLFEFLILGGFQAGLSWITILKKREAFRAAFDDFNPEIIANYDDTKINELLQNEGIIRNKSKIESAIANARAFLRIQKEFGSFDSYIWGFVEGKQVINHFENISDLPTSTPLSDKIAKDLQDRGFNFVGTTIVYAFMQAIGMVNDHLISCFRHSASFLSPPSSLFPHCNFVSFKQACLEIGEKQILKKLLQIYEDGARATHKDLSEEEIEGMKKEIEESILESKILLIAHKKDDKKDKWIGFISLEANEITMLFVAPQYFGSGYGKALIREAYYQYLSDYDEVIVSSLESALGFYQHLGFKKTQAKPIQARVASAFSPKLIPLSIKREALQQSLGIYPQKNGKVGDFGSCDNVNLSIDKGQIFSEKSLQKEQAESTIEAKVSLRDFGSFTKESVAFQTRGEEGLKDSSNDCVSAESIDGEVFLDGFCGCAEANNEIEHKVHRGNEPQTLQNTLKRQANKVLCAVSGGVDSSVVATLLYRAIGENLIPVFVDTGLLRKGEREAVEKMFKENLKVPLITVNASELFLSRLKGVIDPEIKRKIIGETFIEVFEKEAKKHNQNGEIKFLAQGTLYPDVIESVSVKGPSQTIKSHHNVGGLPEWMKFELIEPLRELFKDEVRELGRELGMPELMLMRHPFPGPGLAIRIMGEVNREDLDLLREADSILIEELHKSGLYHQVWQAFCVLLNVKSVGVMGDNRTYDNTICVRAVEAIDGMTASFSHLPHSFLEYVSNRIINEVKGINRVVYDITSKPPGTIEWE